MSRSPDAVAVFTVGLSSDQTKRVLDASGSVWADLVMTSFSSVEETVRSPRRCRLELLVVSAVLGEAAIERGARVEMADGLPRWPVVVIGAVDVSDDVWLVPDADGQPQTLARVFRSAALHHTRWRDSLRAQGDLWTIARRINHEMRSPLGCILTSVDAMREDLAESAPDCLVLADPIAESANEALQLLEQITFVARATAVPSEPESIDMALAVWAARERMAATIQEAGAEVIEPEKWPAVIGRREWVERIWHNLLSNAVRHGGPRPVIRLGWEKHGQDVLFFVQDEGPGVPAEVMSHLFRPFHLMHRIDSGRGLGLAVVQRLVELDGGRSGYEQATPKGARFHFTLKSAGKL